MDLEELILRYYLSLFSIILIILFYLFCLIYLKPITFSKNSFTIPNGSNTVFISNILFENHFKVERYLYNYSLKILSLFKNIHYGTFNIDEKNTFIKLTKLITNYSNVDIKISLIEGWQSYQIIPYLENFFNSEISVNYEDILADTYFFKSANSYEKFIKFIKKNKNNFVNKSVNKNLLKKYTFKEIMIIASLVEKEALDERDKYLISSVIFNRLNINMPLQIDATVIYAITEGNYKFKRKVTYKDLKYNHPFNTYKYKGLPPDLICIVNMKTIEIIMENYKTDFLYYFFDINKNEHIYSKSFNEHKLKLNEYRKK